MKNKYNLSRNNSKIRNFSKIIEKIKIKKTYFNEPI